MRDTTHLEAIDKRDRMAITNRVTRNEDAINFMLIRKDEDDRFLARFFQKFN
jgi:hypothetical protein